MATKRSIAKAHKEYVECMEVATAIKRGEIDGEFHKMIGYAHHLKRKVDDEVTLFLGYELEHDDT